MPILSKIDTFSGIYKDSSLFDALHDLPIDLYGLMKIAQQGFHIVPGQLAINQVDGLLPLGDLINLRVDLDELSYQIPGFTTKVFADLDPEFVLGLRFSRVMVYFGGSGLDYFREKYPDFDIDGYCVDCCLRADDLRFHVTRCDFAFDFINYNTELEGMARDDIIKDLYDLSLTESYQYGKKWHCTGSKTPMSVSFKYSDMERTIYFGNPKSKPAKMLRVYDKLLESIANHKGKIPEKILEVADGNVYSWIRFELQARREIAHNLLTGKDMNGVTDTKSLDNVTFFEFCQSYKCQEHYFIGALKFIDMWFTPLTCLHGEVYEPWRKWLNCEELVPIIQNLHFYSIDYPLDRGVHFLGPSGNAGPSTVYVAGWLGLGYYLENLQHNLCQLFWHNKNDTPLQTRLKHVRYRKLICAQDPLSPSIPPFIEFDTDLNPHIKDLDLFIKVYNKFQSDPYFRSFILQSLSDD